MTSKTTDVHATDPVIREIRDRHREMATTDHRNGRQPMPTNTGHPLAVEAAVEELATSTVLREQVALSVVTVITVDQHPPEKAIIVHREAMTHGERMAYLVVEEELEHIVLPIHRLVDLVPTKLAGLVTFKTFFLLFIK